jgi:integrase/recombinase XerD
MSKEFVYESSIACHIKGFIEEKKSLGYKYFNESKWMKKFDDYWIAYGYKKTGLTIENLADWIQKRSCEGAKCLVTRISVIRQFSIYLNGLGIPSYCPPIEVRYTKPLIHLLTEPEIKELFTQIDGYRPKKGNADIRRIGNEYPVLFRLIYLNGLRISEACRLSFADVDLDNGTVTILDGKGNKDRIVYLSDDMSRLCLKYFSYLCDKLGEPPVWFFPGEDLESPLSDGTVRRVFDACWSKTSFVANCSRKPTVQGLRHAYVVTRINLWMEQGLDFDHMLPYLSKFLGHKNFNDTYYYYHYAEEAAKSIRKKDTVIDRIIPEVMRR